VSANRPPKPAVPRNNPDLSGSARPDSLPSQPACGTLLLIPNTLDHGLEAEPIEDTIALGVLRAASKLPVWLAENARSARAFLKRVDAVQPLCRPLQQIVVHELPRPRKGSGGEVASSEWERLLQPLVQGQDVGLLSEAGLPGVADPGALVVAAAHRLGLPVRPLPGASSLLLALAASGLNGQSFAFVGYLPQEPGARTQRLLQLEAQSLRTQQTQIFIETPYRNAALMSALLGCLKPDTRLAISCGLTTEHGWTRCRSIAQWRQSAAQLSDRVPAVFALLAGSA